MYRTASKAAASLVVALLIVTGLAVAAIVRAKPPPPAGSTTAAVVPAGGVQVVPDSDEESGDDSGADDRDRFGASCRTETKGSRVTALCHNPYPDTDRVRLHIECTRWWDIDSDSAPAEVVPAGYARLAGRCWEDVGSAWVSHERVRP